jgi:hypothetical protein
MKYKDRKGQEIKWKLKQITEIPPEPSYWHSDWKRQKVWLQNPENIHRHGRYETHIHKSAATEHAGLGFLNAEQVYNTHNGNEQALGASTISNTAIRRDKLEHK